MNLILDLDLGMGMGWDEVGRRLQEVMQSCYRVRRI